MRFALHQYGSRYPRLLDDGAAGTKIRVTYNGIRNNNTEDRYALYPCIETRWASEAAYTEVSFGFTSNIGTKTYEVDLPSGDHVADSYAGGLALRSSAEFSTHHDNERYLSCQVYFEQQNAVVDPGTVVCVREILFT